jgi:PAS domain-containing protein
MDEIHSCDMEWPFDYPASVVEADTSVIFCLDPNLTITYCNPAWDRFAKENGGSELYRPSVIGRSILEFIGGPQRDYYARTYKRLLAVAEPWDHEYECSSKEVYRRFHLRAVPIKKRAGLLVINSLRVERPHQLVPCEPLEEVYRDSTGLIIMCGSCRRTRRNSSGAAL